MVKVHLRHALLKRRSAYSWSGWRGVSLLRYDTGVEAVRLANRRGYVIVLPYFGQTLWDASFDGVRLGMGHNIRRRGRRRWSSIPTGALRSIAAY